MTLEEIVLAAVFLASLGLAVAGVAMISHAAALITAGAALAAVTFLLGLTASRRRSEEDEE